MNAVYLITCKYCRIHYVGETKRRVTLRWKEHIRDVKNKRDTPISIHFNTAGHDFNDASIEIIDVIKGNPDSKKCLATRLKQKKFWIITLQTLNPLGINGRSGRPISS